MFARYRSLLRLRRGIEESMTSVFFGIPEVLVVHYKFDAALLQILNELAKYKVRLVVLSLDSDNVCTDCASIYVKELVAKTYPGAEGIVNVRYFGIPQEYVNEVSAKVSS